MSETTTTMPRCDMTKDCAHPVAYLDRGGYVYCEGHGKSRQMSQPCRKLRPAELRRLERGQTIERY